MRFRVLNSITMRQTASALIASAALACALAPASAETIRWARVGDALTLDPHSQNESPTMTVMHHMYETLVDRSLDGSLQPRLATQWFIHPDDPTVWVFKLREGVKFHGGEEFTAEDVVFSLQRVQAQSSDYRALHANVVEAKAADEHTVHFKMSGPSPLYPQNLTNFFIMDKGWSEANNVETPQDYAAGEEKHSTRNTNGTGPYKLVSRDPEVRTEMVYFEDHWGDKPDVTEIIYTPIKEDATRVAALLSGEVDIVQDVPVQDLARLQNTSGITVTTGPQNRVIFFGYDVASDKLITANVDDNPFKKPQVREAMALALDREAIMKVVMRGQSIPTGVANPPFVNGWTEELDRYEQPDPERAKALLAEAGYPDGFSVDLNCPNDRYINDEAICQAFVAMLGRIGIKANLVAQTKGLHFSLIGRRETDFYMLGWGVSTFDSSFVFDYLLHTDDGTLGTWNGSRYSNPELDEKMKAITTEIDLEKRNAMIAEIWAKIQEDRVLLPVHNQMLAYASREGVILEVHPENQPKMTSVRIAPE